jgi:hypothetical protein
VSQAGWNPHGCTGGVTAGRTGSGRDVYAVPDTKVCGWMCQKKTGGFWRLIGVDYRGSGVCCK